MQALILTQYIAQGVTINVDDFFEFHIEQGPVLEEHDLSVGVVNGIAGAKRFAITLKGLAGHAGTVPMPMRQDALAAASEMILVIERIAIEKGIVATVGQLKCLSGAVNVISGNSQPYYGAIAQHRG